MRCGTDVSQGNADARFEAGIVHQHVDRAVVGDTAYPSMSRMTEVGRARYTDDDRFTRRPFV